MGPSDVYRILGPVDIGPVLRELDRLTFIGVNATVPGKYPQSVVLWETFPEELQRFVNEIPLGGRTARAILRRLPPGVGIPPHVDEWMPGEMDWRRFQLPIVTDSRVVMRWPDDGVDLHLKAGVLYEVRYDRMHEVVNASNKDRIHLQIDQVGATI